MKRSCTVLAVTVMALAMVCAVFAQDGGAARKPASPTGELPEGWQDVDARLVFLTVRLANVESSIEAVRKALGSIAYRGSSAKDEARRAQLANARMDRNGGGPVPWTEFYGRTAEAFYYHPANPYAETGRPIVKPRPPQFDYIYKANQDRQKQADKEVQAIASKGPALLERQQQLEAEQVTLWAKIAFRAVLSREITAQPLYRFKLTTTSATQPASRREVVQGGVAFIDALVGAVEAADAAVDTNRAEAFGRLEAAVTGVRRQFEDQLRQDPSLALEAGSASTTPARLRAAAKRLEDLAHNIKDAYVVSGERDGTELQTQRTVLRRALQSNLIDFAEALLAADKLVTNLASESGVAPDTKMVAAPAQRALAAPVVAEVLPPLPAEPADKAVTERLAAPIPAPSSTRSPSRPGAADSSTRNRAAAAPVGDVPSANQNSSPAAGRAAVAPVGDVPSAGRLIDALRYVDADKHAFKGEWSVTNDGVRKWRKPDGAPNGVLGIPVVPQGDYAVQMRFTRVSGNSHVILILPVGDTAVALMCGTAEPRLDAARGGKVHVERSIRLAANQREHTLDVVVTQVNGQNVEIKSTFDGSPYLHWQGDAAELAQNPYWEVNPVMLGIGGHESDIIFHSVRLRMLNGKAALAPFSSHSK